jgi:hypothetical protein
MANEELSEKVEGAIIGVKNFALRFAKTFVAVGFRPRQLVRAVSDETTAAAFLGPNTFLLSCAVAFGFVGKTLSGGMENIRLDVIRQFKDVTFWSFLIEVVSVFAIAILGSLVIRIMLLGWNAQEKRQIKNVVAYYVVGYFGIGSLVVTLLLFLVLPDTIDFSNWRVQWFRTAATVIVVGWLLAVFALMQWMSFQLLRMAGGKGLMLWAQAKMALVNIAILTLCILNFLSPVYRSSDEIPLQGWLIDLQAQPEAKSIRLTYALRNEADIMLVINQDEPPVLSARLEGRAPLRLEGSFQKGCGMEAPKQPFVTIDPGKTAVLTSCFASQELLELLGDAGFIPTTERKGNGRRLARIGNGALDVSVATEVVVSGRKSAGYTVRLANHTY